MNRTIAALYETRDEADRVAAALKVQGLGDALEIRDAEHDDAKHNSGGLGGWLSGLFAGHDDHHVYAEGLRRGHFLLTTKVDELNETRASSIMDTAAMSRDVTESKWRGDGWAPRTAHSERQVADQDTVDTYQGITAGTGYTSTFGGVRSYTL
jgi:hypothetical protein